MFRCYVEGECGEYTPIIGYWDYCLYLDSSRPDYIALSWDVKQDLIWAKIKENSNLGDYYPQDIVTESLFTSFVNEWDILPAGRRKVCG